MHGRPGRAGGGEELGGIRGGLHHMQRTAVQGPPDMVSPLRQATDEEVAHFAEFTGDTFYAHSDQEAAEANPLFGGIVAHGYLVLSLAAGLFVDPAPGPVLASTGLDRLRFTKPVKAGDSIRAVLTCAARAPRTASQGEVRWDVQALDQDDTLCATYELLTMVSA